MENAVEALKFAGAIMVFALALALSISSFSQASQAVTAIVNMSDRENDYIYVRPANEDNLTRTVGVETVVTSMYRAYSENVKIYFFNSDGSPFYLYNKTNPNGELIKENGQPVGVNYIDLGSTGNDVENYGEHEEMIEHLDILLRSNLPTYDGPYCKQIREEHAADGLYKVLSRYLFEENLGEYYQNEGNSQIKKRVITYKIIGNI